MDLYALLGLANERWTATDAQIKLGELSRQQLLLLQASIECFCQSTAAVLENGNYKAVLRPAAFLPSSCPGLGCSPLHSASSMLQKIFPSDICLQPWSTIFACHHL